MSEIHILKKDGEVLYPQTHVLAVVDDNGNTIDKLIDNKLDKNSISNTTGTSNTLVMSQKSITDAIADEKTRAEGIESALSSRLAVIEGEGEAIEIVNDLTTGGADKALSAEMGKELAKEATTEHKGLMSAKDKKKSDLIQYTGEEGFYITDVNGHIIISVVAGLLDSLGFGDRLTEEIITIIQNNVIPSVNETVNTVGVGVKSLQSVLRTDVGEGGFYIADENGNVAFSVTKDGKVSYIGLGKEGSSEDVNKALEQINKIHEDWDAIKKLAESVTSMLNVKRSGETTAKTITIPSSTEDRKNVVLRVGLHYGDVIGKQGGETSYQSSTYNDVYFEEGCEKNFSDIRFTDNGKVLNHRLEHHGNYEVVRDNNFIPVIFFAVDYETGRIYQSRKYSDDGGASWNAIPNLTSTHGNICFIDSRKILYTVNGSKLYMLKPINGVYDGNNIVEIADVSKTSTGDYDSAYISPGSRLVIEDNDGYIYFGTNGPEWNAVVFRSINADMTPVNGVYVKEVFSQEKIYKEDGSLNYEFVDQHVHNFYHHKPTNTIYVGLDNSSRPYGPRIIKSNDNGNSWTEVRLDSAEWEAQRGRDYIPSYIASDGSFMIGGGEVNILGGKTLCKVDCDVNNDIINEKSIKGVINNGIGVRSASAFDDNFIIAGLNGGSGGNIDIQLVLSEDKGNTWKTIYSENAPHTDSMAGAGVRHFSEPFSVNGEERILITAMQGNPCSALVVYKGNNHYYGEAYVYVGDIPANTEKVISVESNYLLQMPNVVRENRQVISPAYSILLNEGYGNVVKDSLGRTLEITGDYEWDSFDNNMRFGAHTPNIQAGNEMNGLKLLENSYINIGKISSLKFNKGYSISFWYNLEEWSDDYYDIIAPIISNEDGTFSVGLYRAGYAFGSKSNNLRGVGCRTIHKGLYEFVCLSITDADIPSIIISRNDDYGKQSTITSPTSWGYSDLAEMELRIGNVTANGVRNYPIYLHSVSVYDKVLTEDEVRAIYRGGFRL